MSLSPLLANMVDIRGHIPFCPHHRCGHQGWSLEPICLQKHVLDEHGGASYNDS